MESARAFLRSLIASSPAQGGAFKRNLLKEYLQILVLDFLYSHPSYSRLIFYGGSCLSHCFGLPRLSEDLDFVDLESGISLQQLAKDIQHHFTKATDLKVSGTVQKFRVYLKFPILTELGLSEAGQSDLLFLKLELFKNFGFCKNHQIQAVPLFKFNKPIIVKTFDMATLMSTKIRAVLYRKWEKRDPSGRVLAKVKGRDYFDLMWYLQKGYQPNMSCFEGIASRRKLKEKLLEIIETVDERSIQYDLEALIESKNFVGNLSGNIKAVLKRELEKLVSGKV